LWSTLR